jgi:hypothetical protein
MASIIGYAVCRKPAGAFDAAQHARRATAGYSADAVLRLAVRAAITINNLFENGEHVMKSIGGLLFFFGLGSMVL